MKNNSRLNWRRCMKLTFIFTVLLTLVIGALIFLAPLNIVSTTILQNQDFTGNHTSYSISKDDVDNSKHSYIHEIPFQSPEQNSFVYSAYWDERPNGFDNKDGKTANIRIFGAASHSKAPYLNCIFRTNCSWFSSKLRYKSVQDLHGKEYYGYTMSCTVPKDIEYSPGFTVYVSDSTNTICKASALKVQHVSNKKQKDAIDFGICVPPLYGDVKVENLIEFVELSRLLGASKIIIYIVSVSEEVESVLRYYGEKGFIEIFQWKLPNYLAKLNEKIWYNGQDISVQDCLYRNMERMKYIACNDIDEFIIPRKYPDWASLIKHYDNSDKISDFRFTTAFFRFQGQDKKLKNTTGKPNVEIYTQRTKDFIGVRSKCIVKPEQVFDLGTHEINGRLFSNTKTQWVEREDAFLHHYRLCAASCDKQETDTFATKYTKELTKKLQEVKKAAQNLKYKE